MKRNISINALPCSAVHHLPLSLSTTMASLSLPSAFLFLSLLLCTSLTAYGDDTLSSPPAEAPHPPHHRYNHHHHPPTLPPSHPPVHPPVKPPAHPPVKPPRYPPQRKRVAVQGVVYCKSCRFRGSDTLTGASPLAGAVVKLECNNSRYKLRELRKTDKNGYFFFLPRTLTTAGSHKCKVSLVSSPLATCSVPTNLHDGVSGASLFRGHRPPFHIPPKPLPFELFTVGPFAFEAPKKLRCHR